MGKNKPYRNPFAGKRVPTSNVKASKRPGKTKQAAQAAGDGGGAGGGGKPRKRKERSVLGLLAAGAGFAALWAWNVWSRMQQGREDKRILGAMLARPLAVTEHAACRMDCRCAAPAVLPASLQARAASPCAVGLERADRLRCCPLRRHVGRDEVVETLRSGRINSRKSQPALRPCPKYTVDAAVGPKGRSKNVQARRGDPSRLACLRRRLPQALDRLPAAALARPNDRLAAWLLRRACLPRAPTRRGSSP